MNRVNRELLKQAWLAIPANENHVDIKEIKVISNENKDWFIVKTITDTKEFYHSSECGFNTLTEAVKFAKERSKESDSYVDYTKHKLVIN